MCQLNKSKNLCPTCEQEIEEKLYKSLLEKKSVEKISAETEIQTLEIKIKSNQEKTIKLNKNISEIQLHLPNL